MRSSTLASLLGAFVLSAASLGAAAADENTRVAPMPFDECLAIIAEASEEVGEEPVKLVSSDDLTTVRIPASDGFVTVSCNRIEQKMTLTKSAVPAAAGMTAER